MSIKRTNKFSDDFLHHNQGSSRRKVDEEKKKGKTKKQKLSHRSALEKQTNAKMLPVHLKFQDDVYKSFVGLSMDALKDKNEVIISRHRKTAFAINVAKSFLNLGSKSTLPNVFNENLVSSNSCIDPEVNDEFKNLVIRSFIGPIPYSSAVYLKKPLKQNTKFNYFYTPTSGSSWNKIGGKQEQQKTKKQISHNFGLKDHIHSERVPINLQFRDDVYKTFVGLGMEALKDKSEVVISPHRKSAFALSVARSFLNLGSKSSLSDDINENLVSSSSCNSSEVNDEFKNLVISSFIGPLPYSSDVFLRKYSRLSAEPNFT